MVVKRKRWNNAVTIQMSQEAATLMAEDWADFNTVLQNNGPKATPPLRFI